MSAPPSPNGNNGRNPDGTFAKGNPGGPGNPHAKRVAKLRAAAFDAVTVKDIEEIIAVLLRLAKEGDVSAAKEVLGRAVGKPGDALNALDPGQVKLEELKLEKALHENSADYDPIHPCRRSELGVA